MAHPTRTRLTEALLHRLKPEAQDYRISDTECPGFGVAVRAKGTISYWVRVGPDGKKTRRTLGKRGQLTVDSARQLARDALAREAMGDSLVERKANRAGCPTWAAWVDDHERLSEGDCSDTYRKQCARYCRQAPWSRKLLSDITTDDVIKYRNQLASDVGVSTANRSLAAIKRSFAGAVTSDPQRLTHSPATSVKKLVGEVPRKRILQTGAVDQNGDAQVDELGKVAAAIAAEPDAHLQIAFTLMLDAGMRRREVLGLRWSDLDLDNGFALVPRKKDRKPEPVVLPATVCAMLRTLQRWSVYVVPGRDPKKPRSDLKRPWQKILDRAGVEGVTLHDLRRTYGSRLAIQSGLFVASKLLRHADPKTTYAVYAHLLPSDARNAADAAAVASVAKRKRKQLPASTVEVLPPERD